MSITALVFLLGYAGGLLLSFANPMIGLAAYLWTFYNDPASSWWGPQVPDLRWSLSAALVALAAHSLRSVHPQHTDQPALRGSLSGGFWLMAAFSTWTWMQTPWAHDPSKHLEGCILFSKYTVLFFLIERSVVTLRAFDLFSWAHVGGCFWWGWIAYHSNVSGRAELRLGPGVDDSNTLGFHLVTGLAFAGMMLLGLTSRLRLLLLGMIPFILNGVILASSRGATLAMIAGGAATLTFAPRSRRTIILAGAVLGIVLFFQLAGSELFWARMDTLSVSSSEEEQEASAYSRIQIAKANWRMFLDHPLGTGNRGNVILSPEYISDRFLSDTGQRSAHNTFLAVLVDGGFPGIAIFLLLLGWAATLLLRLKRLDRDGLSATFGTYRAALAGGLLAYVVAGQFTNFLTAEVGVWLLALTAALHRIAVVAVEASALEAGAAK